MPERDQKSTKSDQQRPIEVSQELPAWTPTRPPVDPPPVSAPLRRLLADLPDEYRSEPLGVIEAEMRRARRGPPADSPEPPTA